MLFMLLFCLVAESGLSRQQEHGKVHIVVIDSVSKKQIPVRIQLSKDQKPVKNLPDEAIGVMYGHWDHADGFAFQPDSSFYCNGSFQMDLLQGSYDLHISKGNEFVEQHHELVIKPDDTLRKTYEMSRWINTGKKGWYSGDNHIHVRRSPREDPLLMSWIQAEDIHVGVMLRMGDLWETYYAQYDWGEKGVYQDKEYLLTSGQEDPRTPELGHALGIGASQGVRYKQDYYLYDKVFDRLHELGGLTGYAHQAASFHGYRGLTLDGLRGKVDMIELLQFCVSDQPLITDHYYHMLDLGIPMTAVAGSDFPWCGMDHESGPVSQSAQIGNARFYTYTDSVLTYNSWKEGLAAGHTFVSSGPILEFAINEALPGDRIDVDKGATITVNAKAYGHFSQVPLSKLEIVGHGKILGEVTVSDSGQSHDQLSISLDVPILHGMWIAARAYAKPQQVAHTTPIYITVNNGGFHNPETASKYLELSQQYLEELEEQLEVPGASPEHQAWYYKKPLRDRINATREIIDQLKIRLK